MFIVGIVVGIYILYNLIKFMRLFRHRLKLLFRLISLQRKHHDNIKFYIRSYFRFFCCNRGKHSNLLLYINGDLYIIKLFSTLRKVTIINVLAKDEWNIYTFIIRPLLPPEVIRRKYKIEYDLITEKESIANNMWNMPKVLNILPVLIFVPHPTTFRFEGNEMWGKDILYGTYIYFYKAFFKYIQEEYDKYDTKLSLTKKEWINIKKIYKNYHC